MTILHSPGAPVAPKSGVLLVLADLTAAVESREAHLAKLEEYTSGVEREHEEALREVGRLRARVEEIEAIARDAVGDFPDEVLAEPEGWLWRVRVALGLDGATGEVTP